MREINGNGPLSGRALRVLVMAFACCPPGGRRFSGGEDVLGWYLVHQIARFHEAWVITHALDRDDIERARSGRAADNLHLEYVALPRWLQPLLRVPGGVQCYCYLWQIAAFLAARRLARRVQFDLVHHLTYANDWMASYAGAFLPVPYLRGPGGGAHRVPDGLLKEYAWLGRFGEHLRTALQWCFRHDPVFVQGQARARALLLCNREALSAVPARWRHKAQLFPVNGISENDLHRLEPAQTLADAHPLRVLSGGKLVRLKGFGLAIRAFAKFSERHPEARLEIVGDGPDRSYLQALIARLGLESRVQLRPAMRRDAFLDALRQCDVFLFPSLRDGGGAVVVEAMAAAKQVLCLDLAGPALHVTPTCGIKVRVTTPNGVISALAAALELLAEDAARRIAMGRAGRQRAEAVYQWDRLGHRLQEVYERAIGMPRPLSPDGSPQMDASARKRTRAAAMAGVP